MEEKSLGIKLVNQGYDLWMNNSRGNRYSRDHQTLDVDTDLKKYFDFSFSELGEYDQIGLWEYVMKVTGAEKISYIGHSQGTTQMFATLCDNHDFFKNKLKIFIAIAPVVSVINMDSKFLQE